MEEELIVEQIRQRTSEVLDLLKIEGEDDIEKLENLDEEIARLDSDDPRQRIENITSFMDERTTELADDQRRDTKTFLGARISAVHFERRHGNRRKLVQREGGD